MIELASGPSVRGDVDIVVTHYEDARRLAWVIDSLAVQSYSRGAVRVVVADDGSRRVPAVPVAVRVVAQADEGFRAAAARNLGASVGDAPVVLFVDGDTVPEPDFVAQMVAALAASDDGWGALVVGARHHADLSGLDAAGGSVARWVSDPATREPAHRLDDPAWLHDGYARTEDLTCAGDGDWRFVISACLGMTRTAFEALGGFDETLVGYGGEDWDLAYRAWNTGVTLRHAPQARAWHDGPDAGGRGGSADLRRIKADEQVALTRRIPQPLVRGRGGVWRVPRVAVHVRFGDLTSTSAFAVIESWLVLGDVALFSVPAAAAGLFAADPRVRTDDADDDVRMRAEFVVELGAAVVLCDVPAFWRAVATAPREGDGVRGGRTRDVRRREPAQRWPEATLGAVSMLTPDGPPVDLEAWGRRWWR